MSNRFISGTDGRVRVGLANNIVAGITMWKFAKKTNLIMIPHFESLVDPNGLVYPNLLLGLSGATGSLEGYFDTDPTNTTDIGTPGLYNGAPITLDLMISKAFTWGFYNIPAVLSDFEATQAVENQPAKWTAAFTVNGIPGYSSGTPA